MKQKWDRHLNEHEGKLTVDPVVTYSVSSQHERNHEDNQRKKMKSNEELVELLQTETTHIMKTIHTKPILKTSSRRGDPARCATEVGITHLSTLRNIWIWLMVVRTWILRMERTTTAER